MREQKQHDGRPTLSQSDPIKGRSEAQSPAGLSAANWELIFYVFGRRAPGTFNWPEVGLLLDAAREEARRPLVEALEEAAELIAEASAPFIGYSPPWHDWNSKRDDALARIRALAAAKEPS